MQHFQALTPFENHVTETNSTEKLISGKNLASESRDEEEEEDMSFDTEEIRHLKLDFKGADLVGDSADETSDLMQMTTCFGGFIHQTQEKSGMKEEKYPLIDPCLDDMFELDDFLKKDEENVMQMPFDTRSSMSHLESTKENPRESHEGRSSSGDDDMKETLAFDSLIVTTHGDVFINPSRFESTTPNPERKEEPDQVLLKANQDIGESSPILPSSSTNDVTPSQEAIGNIESNHGLSSTLDPRCLPKSPEIIESNSKPTKMVHEIPMDQTNNVQEIEGEDMEIIGDLELNDDMRRFKQPQNPGFQIVSNIDKFLPTERSPERSQMPEFALSESSESRFTEIFPSASSSNLSEQEEDSNLSMLQLTYRLPTNEDSNSLSLIKLPFIGRPDSQTTVSRPTESQISGELKEKEPLDLVDQLGSNIGMTLKEFLRFVDVRFLDTLTATNRRETLGHLRNAGRYESEFPLVVS
jgi:hypothetical protein